MLKEKLGICLYEENYYQEEIIKIRYEEPIKEISKVSNNKSAKKLTKELIKESDNESIKKSDNESIKESNNESIKESDNESIEESDNESIEEINKESEEESIKDLKEPFSLNNKSATNWHEKNKSNKILTAIDSNGFNHKNKIGNLKFNNISNLVNDIKNNTIREALAKKN